MFRYYIHLSTIQPRFPYLNGVINSWLNQTIKPEKIIITTSICDKRYTTHEILEQYKSDKVLIQILDVDYGPNNKILGALKFYENLEDKENIYIIICDDDIIYNEKTVKSYKDYIEKYYTNKDDYIYTYFYTPYCRFINKFYGLEHLQGADTYLLTRKFLTSTTYAIYEEYLKNSVEACPDIFFQDDYVISYFIHFICKLKVKHVPPYSSYKKNDSIPNDTQMHIDLKVHERECNVIKYFNSLILKNE